MKQIQFFPSQDLMDCLKIWDDLAVLIEEGRQFHVKLPRKTKEFVPNVFVLVWGSIKFAPDLKLYLQGFVKNMFLIIIGFKLLIEL